MAHSVVELSGHIIDSLILPKVLDLIINLGGEFEILEIEVGHRRTDRSSARIKVETLSDEALERILASIREHGALPLDEREESVQIETAPRDGIFPDGFYATTNLPTMVRLNKKWLEVLSPET